MSTTWGNGSTTTSRSEYGYTGLYQLFMTLPPTPGPATVTATYNGHTATARIASPSINGTSGLAGTDRLDMIITYSTVTATPTPTPTPTVTPTATATPTATVMSTGPVPSATVPAGNVSTNETAPSNTIAPSAPPVTTPTAKPPMFQTGYGEQVLLVMAALGITAVLLRKKD